MGFVDQELWKCKCGFKVTVESGIYEVDPNDFGTTHSISGYHCSKCGNIKNVSQHFGFDEPKEYNKDCCVTDSDICEKCGTKMNTMDKKTDGLLCPKCKKETLKFKEEIDSWMT